MNGDDKFVCVNCFEDTGMVNFIKENAVAKRCSFCPSVDSVPIAASTDCVSEHFIECLFQEYDLAVNQLSWVGSEGVG